MAVNMRIAFLLLVCLCSDVADSKVHPMNVNSEILLQIDWSFKMFLISDIAEVGPPVEIELDANAADYMPSFMNVYSRYSDSKFNDHKLHDP